VGQARSSATLLLSDGDIMGFNSPGQSTHKPPQLAAASASSIDFNNLLNKPDMNLYLLKSGGAMTGNLGIGTTNNPNATLELYSTSQLTSKIILSGQIFYTNTLLYQEELLCYVVLIELEIDNYGLEIVLI
jgi:hypothetical protein